VELGGRSSGSDAHRTRRNVAWGVGRFRLKSREERSVAYEKIPFEIRNPVARIGSLYFSWAGRPPDARKGDQAFLDKRPPQWRMKISKELPEFFPRP